LLAASTYLLEEHACDAGEQCASAPAVGEECHQWHLRPVCRDLVKFQKLVVDQEEVSGGLESRGTQSDE
jgi:hypothetical protein